MGIYSYIRDILLFNGTVTVPGLGFFTLKKEPSEIKGNRISPPRSRIIFEQDQDIDDDILKLKISEGEEISMESAGQTIQNYVDEIFLAFDQRQNFEINTLGILYRDTGGYYHYEPDPELNLDFDAFGLETFELEEIEDEGLGGIKDEGLGDIKDERLEDIEDEGLEDIETFVVELKDEGSASVLTEQKHEDVNDNEFSDVSHKKDTREEKSKVERYVLQDNDEEKDSITAKNENHPIKEKVPIENDYYLSHVDPKTPTTSDPKTFIYDNMANTKNKKRKNRNTLWILIGSAVVILLAFILLPIKTNLFNNGLQLGFLNRADSFIIDDNFSELNDEDMDFDALISKMEKDIDSATGKEVVKEYSKAEEVNEKTIGKYVEYHIIAGSFKSKKNASKLQQNLTVDGYPSLVIERGDGFYRVSAIGFKDQQTALNELNKFRGRKDMKSAWILGLK